MMYSHDVSCAETSTWTMFLATKVQFKDYQTTRHMAVPVDIGEVTFQLVCGDDMAVTCQRSVI